MRLPTTTLLLAFLLQAPSTARAQPTVAANPAGATLDDYLDRMSRLGWSGAALVARHDTLLLAKGYGLADRSAGRPVTDSTVFSLGSITKQFTAAAILKLEQEGRLRVTDSIGSYLPNVPSDKRGITLHELLTHTAGLREDYGPSDFEPVERAEYIARVMRAPLVTPPGTAYRYSNAGYSLLAAIIELVTGDSYERYLHDHVLVPAGMGETGYKLPAWPRERVARGYGPSGRDWGTFLEKPWAADGPYWNARGNGELHTTVHDMYRWARSLEGNAVLDSVERAKMATPWVREGEDAPSFYGYGTVIFTTQRGTKILAHNGGNGIFSADFMRYVDEGVVVIVFSNTSAVRAFQLSPTLGRIALGLDVEMPPRVVALTPARAAALGGSWALPSGARLRLTPNGGAFTVVPENREAFELVRLPVRVPASEVAENETSTRRVIEAASRGDFAPIAAAFGTGLPVERVREEEGGMWQEWRERFGAFEGVEIFGATRTGAAGPGYVARLRFARGASLLVYVWEGGQLRAVMPYENVAPKVYPTGADSLLAWSPDGAPPLGVTVHGEGAIMTLQLLAPDGTRHVLHRIAAPTGS
jgi:CubicO group peptidase (beta-lactamase class C family)